MEKIFIVEDDEDIREIVLYAMQSIGYEALGFENARDFFAEMEASLPSLVLLDIMLPGDDGLAILKCLRSAERTKKLPVIMLTAKSSELDKVRGLDLGADDYIAKPFGVMELISRVKAVLRRVLPETPPSGKQFTFGMLAISHDSREVFVDGEKVPLTFKEFELLCYLALKPGRVMNRDKIMEMVWGYEFEGESRTLDMHIRSLRQKLGNAGAYIHTIRNVGYKLGV
jgi:two-component system alkaline phosphatase synthesis response regulator PhoP